MGVYEVFRQSKEDGPMEHVGSLRAPDPDLACHYARDQYGRRKEALRLWVVARADVHEVSDPDWLQPPFDRPHRRPAGYSAEIKRKLALVRERAAEEAAAVDDGYPQPHLTATIRPKGRGGASPEVTERGV